jgi:hypothetical protein
VEPLPWLGHGSVLLNPKPKPWRTLIVLPWSRCLPSLTFAASVTRARVSTFGTGMRKFLVEDKQFNVDRIENLIKRLQKTQGTNTQARLDSFFVKKDPPNGVKRPAPALKGKDAKKAKGGKPAGKGK